MSAPVASTASSQQRRVLQSAALALRILFRLGTDAALYGYLFTFWAGFFGGFILMSFGYRVCGEGSTVQALGEALLSPSLDFLERFFPAFAVLFVMRIIHIAYVMRTSLLWIHSACAEPHAKEEKERYMGKKCIHKIEVSHSSKY
ncbi:hypothetical protein EJB05_49173 [Eragrostis curvula]|uniref:Uncharacterized protein n=1 Tax=Eragrostis curvula TaxID=38414 RepID=A0A5J9T3L8_9POAL|nr:hypothetical protein EJB05_49173 [Eragrostis curvula]